MLPPHQVWLDVLMSSLMGGANYATAATNANAAMADYATRFRGPVDAPTKRKGR